ncbi:MAG: hypothetical protein F6K42_13565 [Leptolyngbya sp. SIO1D8]|nr:hypothetical protein [Leptolyngbya sp. SIO1D8]
MIWLLFVPPQLGLLDVGGFVEDLGRKGKNLLSEEERLANLTLQKQGGQFYYIPEASVQHWIPEQRLNRSWLLRRCYWQGRSVAVVDRRMGKAPFRQRWESLLGLINLRRLGAQFLPDAHRRIRTQTGLVWQWGYFWQTWITGF